jgi:CubicO group peptidase (beta-lactamase class C family)
LNTASITTTLDIMKATTVCRAALFTTLVGFATASYYCPPLGPVLPAPKQPSKSTAIQSAINNLQNELASLTSAIRYSAALISIQSLHETTPLFQWAYTPPNVDPRSVAKVDASTKFRVGSIPEVFTTLAVLLSPDVRLDDAMTKWLLELRNLRPTAPDIDGFPATSWDDVTLGALASHMAGIGSDGELSRVCSAQRA